MSGCDLPTSEFGEKEHRENRKKRKEEGKQINQSRNILFVLQKIFEVLNSVESEKLTYKRNIFLKH